MSSDSGAAGGRVTVAIPSLNQGRYLDDALTSVFSQKVPVEVFLADGGSTDGSLEVIERWRSRLNGWRSHPDDGQSAAINECVAMGSAPYVCWLNSDDMFLPDGLAQLVEALDAHPEWPAVYGRAWNVDAGLKRLGSVPTRPFNETLFANFCFIAQPATLIRRSVWESLSGLRGDLTMAMDYDLWWRIYRRFGRIGYIDRDVALNRVHDLTKTNSQRKRHYREAMAVVKTYYGRVPLKWWLAWPYAVWFRSLSGRFGRQRR